HEVQEDWGERGGRRGDQEFAGRGGGGRRPDRARWQGQLRHAPEPQVRGNVPRLRHGGRQVQGDDLRGLKGIIQEWWPCIRSRQRSCEAPTSGPVSRSSKSNWPAPPAPLSFGGWGA